MQTTSHRQFRRAVTTATGVVVLGCLCGVVGCRSFPADAAPVSRLDSGTGATIANADELKVFARLDARYSRSMRDYVYLGPAETNRQGVREYFLWVGIASTLDRGYLAPEAELPTEIEMTIQNEPMTFTLASWPPPYLSSGSADLYRTPVALRGQLAARVTLDQLRLIDAAALDSIRVRGADGRLRAFSIWPTSSDWSRFLNARR